MTTDCQITFKVSVKTSGNEKVGIVGNQPELGMWEHSKIYELETDEETYPIWRNPKFLSFKRGTKLEFKFVILSNNPIWEELPQNRKYRARYQQVALTAEWNNYNGKEIIVKKFQSSVCLNEEELANYKKKYISKNFDPFQQANDDSEDSDGVDSFIKQMNKEQQSDSSGDEPVLAKRKLTIQVGVDTDFQSLYSTYLENPKMKQIRFDRNDILYEVNEDPLISVNEDELLAVATFYLPIVVHIRNGEYVAETFQHSFSMHLLEALKNITRKWFGVALVYNEQGQRVYEINEGLRTFLDGLNCVAIELPREDIDYFNDEFCEKFYQPIMNNNVCISRLIDLDYSDKMQDSFKQLSTAFLNSIKKHSPSVAYVGDYRLIYLATCLGIKSPRLPISIFYNRTFPHIDNLKLIPFYREILNSFLMADVICFSNYDTANQFLQIMKDLYSLEFHSVRGNLAFKYFGREIYVKLQNPGITRSLCPTPSMNNNYSNEIIIASVDNAESIELKLKHLLKYLQTSRIIQENHQIKMVQIYEGKPAEFQLVQQINEQAGFEFITVQNCNRYELFKRANLYLQTKYSGRHDFYLLEYIHLSHLPAALISDSSCYHKGCQSVKTFNVFSHREFSDKLTELLTVLISKSYSFVQTHLILAQADQDTVRNHQTQQWFESLYIDAKKVASLQKFAKVSISQRNGQMVKIAHTPKYKHLEPSYVVKEWVKGKNRIIILEFESILSGEYMIDYKPKKLVQQSPQGKNQELPILIRLVDPTILELIRQLSKVNRIFIISSGMYNEMQHAFNGVNVSLFAENGFLFRHEDNQWNQLFKIDLQGIHQIHKIFINYAQKTEGAVVNVKESAISWQLSHEEEYARHQIKDLVQSVQIIVERYPELCLNTNANSVEVCPSNLNKGAIIELILQKECLTRGKTDFLMLLGRGFDDEDMFFNLKVIKQNHRSNLFNDHSCIYSISLGLVPSYAHFYMKQQCEIATLLEMLNDK